MARETWVWFLDESYKRLKKWYFMPPCLTHSIIRYISWVKWGNSGKGVAPSPIPWYCSYWKGSLWVALGYGRHLYFTYTVVYIINSVKVGLYNTVEYICYFICWDVSDDKSLCNPSVLPAFATSYIYIYI